MPKTHHSPPKAGKTPSMETPVPDAQSNRPTTGITTRSKRQLAEDSPLPREISLLKSELMQMLTDWKLEQDQTLNKWKSDQETTLAILVKDVLDVKAQCQLIQRSNLDIEKGMEFINNSYEDMKERMAQLEKSKLENTDHISNLEKQIQDLEYKTRSATIELRNIPNKDEEKPEDLVAMLSKISKVVNNKTIDKSDLRDIYRLPGKTSTSRPVVAEFSTVTARNDFLASVKTYNKDRSLIEKLNSVAMGLPGDKKPIYVDEHLTPALKKLLYDTRVFAKTHSFSCWHSNGKILLKTNSTDKPLLIKSAKCLLNLSTNK